MQDEFVGRLTVLSMVYSSNSHIPVIIKLVLFIPVFPVMSVAVQVWMPVSPD